MTVHLKVLGTTNIVILLPKCFMVLTLVDEEAEDEDGTGLGSQNKVLKSEVSKHKQQLERLQQKVLKNLSVLCPSPCCIDRLSIMVVTSFARISLCNRGRRQGLCNSRFFVI